MMQSTLAQAAESMQGTLLGADGAFHGVSTDTRTVRAGQLFFALHGPNFDGREFVGQAAGKHAAAAVVEQPVEAGIANIAVADTRLALGRLAASWRRQMPARVVGITGSNGKTTLKEMVASGLSLGAEILATEGNLNNDIGLPLMLMRLGREHEYAVLEMGANHAGEIAYLAKLAAPHVVAITNAGPAHLEGFGSIPGVARAKGEILEVDPRPEHAVLNADDEFFALWQSMSDGVPVTSFGLAPDANVRATNIRPLGTGSVFTLAMADSEIEVSLPLAGRHNVVNACAAAAVLSVLGVSHEHIRDGLERVAPVAGRLRPLRGIAGITVYDDSYNANPASVIAAAGFLAAQKGESWLVLGDMAELGDDAALLHETVGQAARTAGVCRLFATGEMSKRTVMAFGDRAEWFDSVDSVIEALRDALGHAGPVNVLVKGSRSMRMERVVRALTEGAPEREGD